MYAHKAMEMLLRYKGMDGYGKDKRYKFLIDTSIEGVFNSIKITLPSNNTMCEQFKNMRGTVLLGKEHSKYIKAPYNNCWFDWDYEYDAGGPYDKKAPASKRGILLRDFSCGEMPLYIAILFCYFDEYKQWSLSPSFFYLSPGIELRYNDIFKKFAASHGAVGNEMANYVSSHKNMHWMCVPMFDESKYSREDRGKFVANTLMDAHADIETISGGMILMNCKNIGTDKVRPSLKLNKKRKKNGKVELFTYHVLKIKTSKSGKHEDGTVLTGGHYRHHFCRGHFKEYTEEKPLFGRFTGMYWWDAHLRGRNKKGFVYKDYEVEAVH
jgi:hypothetical protein